MPHSLDMYFLHPKSWSPLHIRDRQPSILHTLGNPEGYEALWGWTQDFPKLGENGQIPTCMILNPMWFKESWAPRTVDHSKGSGLRWEAGGPWCSANSCYPTAHTWDEGWGPVTALPSPSIHPAPGSLPPPPGLLSQAIFYPLRTRRGIYGYCWP